MEQALNKKFVYWIGGLFILVNSILIATEFYYAPLLPIALAIVLLALISLDKLILLIVFCTPLSINITDIGGGVGMAIPTDPLLFGVMILFFIKLLTEGKFKSEIFSHPITIAIIVNLVWVAITATTSSMPVVSFKFLLSRIWFLVTYYFLAAKLFENQKNVYRYLWLYILPLIIVIGYTVYRHSLFGFEQKPANWVMTPFYNDHTVYGAVLAMFFPLLIYFTFGNTYGRTAKIFIAIVLIVFIVALILSYTRAAWISLFAAFGIYIVMKLRIRFTTLLALGGVACTILALSWSQIQMKLEKNRQDSADDLSKHLQSVSNITSDASNLERLNRWNSAFRMFNERPFMGWGPGTYAFKYAPFQLSKDKTIISTNAGDLGNAHSEYIGPLAESGIFGMLSMLLILITSVYTGVTLYFKVMDPKRKVLIMSITLGLITYFIHGFLNNFLDTDKASCLFWGFMAILVVLDIQYRKGLNSSNTLRSEVE